MLPILDANPKLPPSKMPDVRKPRDLYGSRLKVKIEPFYAFISLGGPGERRGIFRCVSGVPDSQWVDRSFKEQARLSLHFHWPATFSAFSLLSLTATNQKQEDTNWVSKAISSCTGKQSLSIWWDFDHDMMPTFPRPGIFPGPGPWWALADGAENSGKSLWGCPSFKTQ